MSANPFSSKPRSGAGSASTASSPDFEVLPPDQPPSADKGQGHQAALAHLIAYVMDNLIRVPGTKARIGLTPIIEFLSFGGIVPIGDGVTAVINAVTILEGVRRGVPKVVLARMGANVLLNALVGIIPGVGEAFAFWFKPSQRNYHLLLKHGPVSGGAATVQRRTTFGDWAFVFGLIAVMLMIIGAFIWVGFSVAAACWHLLQSALGVR